MLAPAITGPFLAASVLLGTAGAAKVVRPVNTANALRIAGIRASVLMVRIGAAVEIAIALGALSTPSIIGPCLVAVSYLAFAVFIALAIRRSWPISSCGCFGRPDMPPGYVHLVVDLGAAAVSLWWLAAGHPRPLGVIRSQPWDGLPLLLVTLVLTFVTYVIFTNPLAAARSHKQTGATMKSQLEPPKVARP